MINRHIVALVLSTAVAVSASVTASADEAIPNLVGSWTGTFTGGVRLGGGDLAPADPTPTFVHEGMNRQYVLKIEQQQGRGLIGTWSSTKGGERIQGVIRLDNQTVLLVDPDSYLTARILSPNEIELCNQTTNAKDRFAFCFRLRRSQAD
jgi:hypothetical protein